MFTAAQMAMLDELNRGAGANESTGGSDFEQSLDSEGITDPHERAVARSIYEQESGSGRNTRTSSAGAVGGMQVMPRTFAEMADPGWDINDPEHNQRAGIRYVHQMYVASGGDAALTGAGYYGGPGGMEKARRGAAVSDPRNPNAPTTLGYGQQIASRVNSQVRSGSEPGGILSRAQALMGRRGDAQDALYAAMNAYAALPIYEDRPAPPAPEPEPKRTALGTLGDFGVSALKGIVGVPQSAVGLADLATGGRVGKALDDAANSPGLLGYITPRFKDTQDLLDSWYSPAQQAANRRVAQAQGFWDTAGAMLHNPSTIATGLVEAAPLAIGGAGAVGRGAAWGLTRALGSRIAPAVADVVGASVGQAVVASGSMAENLRAANPDGLLTPEQTQLSLLDGAQTALTTGFSAGLARKLGLHSVPTMAVQGRLGTAGQPVERGLVKTLLGDVAVGVTGMAPQAMGESALQNLAQGRPWDEGLGAASARGLVMGTAMGLGGGLLGYGGDRRAAQARAQGLDLERARSQAGPLLQLGYDPQAGAYTVFPDGTVALNSEAAFQHRYAPQRATDPDVGRPMSALDQMVEQASEDHQRGQLMAQESAPLMEPAPEQSSPPPPMSDSEAFIARARKLGINKPRAINLYEDVAQARQDGLIDQAQHDAMVERLRNDATLMPNVGRDLRAIRNAHEQAQAEAATRAEVTQQDAQAQAEDMARTQQRMAERVARERQEKQAAREAAARDAATQEDERVAARDELLDGLDTRLASDGKRPATDVMRRRLLLAAGYGADGSLPDGPLTPRSFKEVSEAEAAVTGEPPVSVPAIANWFQRSVGLTQDDIFKQFRGDTADVVRGDRLDTAKSADTDAQGGWSEDAGGQATRAEPQAESVQVHAREDAGQADAYEPASEADAYEPASEAGTVEDAVDARRMAETLADTEVMQAAREDWNNDIPHPAFDALSEQDQAAYAQALKQYHARKAHNLPGADRGLIEAQDGIAARYPAEGAPATRASQAAEGTQSAPAAGADAAAPAWATPEIIVPERISASNAREVAQRIPALAATPSDLAVKGGTLVASRTDARTLAAMHTTLAKTPLGAVLRWAARTVRSVGAFVPQGEPWLRRVQGVFDPASRNLLLDKRYFDAMRSDPGSEGMTMLTAGKYGHEIGHAADYAAGMSHGRNDYATSHPNSPFYVRVLQADDGTLSIRPNAVIGELLDIYRGKRDVQTPDHASRRDVPGTEGQQGTIQSGVRVQGEVRPGNIPGRQRAGAPAAGRVRPAGVEPAQQPHPPRPGDDAGRSARPDAQNRPAHELKIAGLDFDQALGDLAKALDQIERGEPFTRKSIEELGRAAIEAPTETWARLIEAYLADPEALRAQAPMAHAFVRAALQSGSAEHLGKYLTGKLKVKGVGYGAPTGALGRVEEGADSIAGGSANSGARFSITESTRSAYERRIDALWNGDNGRARGVTILNRSDMMGLLGHEGKPLVLNEPHIADNMSKHPELGPSELKKLPDWLENPAAVYTDPNHPGRYMLVAPERVRGAPVIMAVDPRAGAPTGQGKTVFGDHLLVTAYPKASGPLTSLQALATMGKLQYVDTKKAPVIWSRPGDTPRQLGQTLGAKPILSEKNLAGWRKANPYGEEPPSGPPGARFSLAPPFERAPLAPDQGQAVRSLLGTITQTIKDAAGATARHVMLTSDLIRAASKVLPAAQRYHDLMLEGAARRNAAEHNIDTVLHELNGLSRDDQAQVQSYLKSTALDRKWGYLPEHLSEDLKNSPGAQVDGAKAVEFNRLPPAARAVVKRMFQHNHDAALELRRQALDAQASEHDALIEEARLRGDQAQVRKLQDAKLGAMETFDALVNLDLSRPYTPLGRFGDFVVIGRSQQMLDAERLASNEDASAAERQRAREQVKEMRRDAAHYFVAFRETRGEMRKLDAQIRALGRYGHVESMAREERSYRGQGNLLQAFYQLKQMVGEMADSHLRADASDALGKLLADLHLQLLAENSARHALSRAEQVAGFDDDMVRSFETRGRATAAFTAALNSTREVQKQIGQMRKQVRSGAQGTVEQRQDWFNEILKRHMMGLDYQPAPTINKVMAATSVWQLLTSPSYYLTNLTQPWAMSLPVMAGKHGEFRSANELLKAYKDTLPALNDHSKLPADVRSGIKTLTDMGIIDVNLTRDMGRWGQGGSHLAARAMYRLRNLSERVEAVNRLSTAIAALRLEAGRGASTQQALAYAREIVDSTHGDYSGYNAPRLMRTPVGRMLTQFRKFQLIQGTLFVRMALDSLQAATPGERAVARRALAYSIGHMGALGGAVGLPAYGLASFILSALAGAVGDKDEPWDTEQKLREAIGDPALATLLARGIPAALGVDISRRVGAGDAYSLLPYTDAKLDKKGYPQMVTAALGPFIGGLAPNMLDGVDKISQGQYWKGLELLLPRGLRDASKGARQYTQGVSSGKDDLLISADDYGFADALLQAVGLPTTLTSERNRAAGVAYAATDFYKERSADVTREYLAAHKDSDTVAMAEARDAWMKLQEGRVKQGFKRQPLSQLIRAAQEQRRRQHNTAGGVQYRRDNKAFVQRLVGGGSSEPGTGEVAVQESEE